METKFYKTEIETDLSKNNKSCDSLQFYRNVYNCYGHNIGTLRICLFNTAKANLLRSLNFNIINYPYLKANVYDNTTFIELESLKIVNHIVYSTVSSEDDKIIGEERFFPNELYYPLTLPKYDENISVINYVYKACNSEIKNPLFSNNQYNFKIVLINCIFTKNIDKLLQVLKKDDNSISAIEYNRTEVLNIFIRYGLFCTFDDNEYPGVNIKYFYNKNNLLKDGICHCRTQCPIYIKSQWIEGNCIPLTIFIFRSGKILINSGRDYCQNNEVYTFVNKILDENRDKIILIYKNT